MLLNRERNIEDAAEDKKFCGLDGKLHLDHSHAYYYQVQTQLFIANVDYGDFCVCTFSQNQDNDVHIERIVKDQEFLG